VKGGTASGAIGWSKLGMMELSRLGLGVQNVCRTCQTTIPSQPERIRIIRTAFDRGITAGCR
jgi:aryl-alcohol dehydrogenase-like predicted oxidoreductase